VRSQKFKAKQHAGTRWMLNVECWMLDIRVHTWFMCVSFMLFVCEQPLFAAEPFESAALVDSFDFAYVKGNDKLLFDIESEKGNTALLEHVLLAGATTILWRNCGGATMRYQSTEERYPLVEAPLDKRRLPDNRSVHGWLRMYQAEPDILRCVHDLCRERNVQYGVHWPFEDTHWSSWTFGAWNLEHPQYWCKSIDGRIWAGRCSFVCPEVVEHKMRLADELVDRGIDHLFVDTWRSGAWSPRFEYVDSRIKTWRENYNEEPPDDYKDPRWCKLVSETNHAYFKTLRNRLNSSGRKIRFMIGVSGLTVVNEKPDEPMIERGVDWKRLVEEGIIDTLVVMGVQWDEKHHFESTRQIYRSIMKFCDGRCQVLFPVQAYNYTKHGIPEYQKASKKSAADVAEQLMRIAWEEGADGIVMECVDYNNYKPETRDRMCKLLNGDCKFKKKR